MILLVVEESFISVPIAEPVLESRIERDFSWDYRKQFRRAESYSAEQLFYGRLLSG